MRSLSSFVQRSGFLRGLGLDSPLAFIGSRARAILCVFKFSEMVSMAYQILLVDQNTTLALEDSSPKHIYRCPEVGEHILIKWQDQTKVCEVEDVWTHVNLDQNPPRQGAVQVLVRWSHGIDPALYVRRFR